MSLQSINSVLYLDAQPFTTVTGDNNDLVLTSSNLQVTVTTDNDALTGLVPPVDMDGAQCWVTNASVSNNLVLKNNTGSTVPFRFILPSGDQTLAPLASLHVGYAFGVGWIPIN